MKCSPGTSKFLEEISSLSHSIVFLYFFALITEEGLLISPCYSLELCVQMGISLLFSFAFCFSSFHNDSSDVISFFPMDYLWSSWWFSNREYSLDSSCKPHTHIHTRTHSGRDWGSSQCSSAIITHLSLWHIRGRQELYSLLSPYPFLPETSYSAHQQKKYYSSVQGHALSTHSIKLEDSLMGVKGK